MGGGSNAERNREREKKKHLEKKMMHLSDMMDCQIFRNLASKFGCHVPPLMKGHRDQTLFE